MRGSPIATSCPPPWTSRDYAWDKASESLSYADPPPAVSPPVYNMVHEVWFCLFTINPLFRGFAELLSSSGEVVQPFIMGCDSKNPKMVHLSLTAIQRMVQHQVISAVSS